MGMLLLLLLLLFNEAKVCDLVTLLVDDSGVSIGTESRRSQSNANWVTGKNRTEIEQKPKQERREPEKAMKIEIVDENKKQK